MIAIWSLIFAKGGRSWDTPGGQYDTSQQISKRAAKRAAIVAVKGGVVSWADAQDSIVCFNCGMPGHKSTECYNRSSHHSAAQPAVTPSWGADYAGHNRQFSGPSAEQAFPALEWHQD